MTMPSAPLSRARVAIAYSPLGTRAIGAMSASSAAVDICAQASSNVADNRTEPGSLGAGLSNHLALSARRQGRQRCPQSAGSEGGSPEEVCTTKEIHDAEVNVLSMCGGPGPQQVLWPSLATRAREFPALRVLLGAVNIACTKSPPANLHGASS